MTQEITVKFVNAPKAGGRLGNISDTGGNKWYSEWDLIKGVQPGNVLSAETGEMKFKDGKILNTIVSFSQDIQSARALPGNGLVTDSGSSRPDMNKFIFVTGVVGRAMGSGKFDASDIEPLTLAAIKAFWLFDSVRPVQPGSAAVGGQALNNEIPF